MRFVVLAARPGFPTSGAPAQSVAGATMFKVS
jgi:hypothetical protein